MSWSGGLARWEVDNVVYLSVAFTWKVEEAYSMALFEQKQGRTVIAGGPGLFLKQCRDRLSGVATVQNQHEDAISQHNPLATIASRGCPVGCSFCIVPAMEGLNFTLIPEFPVRPVLCDNNLSALPLDYQKHIIERYEAEGVNLIDANSGFEPITFTPEVYHLWSPLVNAGRGPWRFAYDEMGERKDVHSVMKMLEKERSKRKRVYVLIGNEPFDDCMTRIEEVIAGGCEPHVQPVMKLNATSRRPWVRFDWSERLLMDVARWANGFVWKKVQFKDYLGPMKTRHSDDSQIDLYDETTLKCGKSTSD